MATVRSLKPKEKYSEWIKSFITFTTPTKIADARSLGIINDTYKECSIKSGTRQNRGSAGQRVQLEGFKQHMLQGEKWKEFLHSGENKNALINLISNFLESEEGRNHLNLPTVVTSGERTIKIQDGQVIEMFNCNHEEADTRLILHSVLLEGDVIVVAKDTDVLIVMIWAYHALEIRYQWFMKYDHDKYAKIDAICKFLGGDLCSSLPAIHALSGCDTTSFFYRVGKVKLLKKILNHSHRCELITAISLEQTLSESDIKK